MSTGNPIPEFDKNKKPPEQASSYMPITIDQSFEKFMGRGEMFRTAFHEIVDLSEDINNSREQQIRVYYPGWTQDDFKILADRLTQAIKEGKLNLI